MDFDKGESPGSLFVELGQNDNPLPADLDKPRPEVKLAAESWLARAIRIAVVSILAFWTVAGIMILIVR